MLAATPIPVTPLPASWVALPLAPPDRRPGGLDVRILARKAAGAWQFVAVRSGIDAEVYLGALCDDAGAPHAHIEIWVQRPAADRPHAGLPAPTGAALDDLWTSHFAQWRRAAPGLHIQTGLEAARTPLSLHPAGDADPLTFNPQGGLLAFTLRLPHSLLDVADALTAQDPEHLDIAQSPDAESAGPMYFTLHDASARLAETLYLKLALLLQCAQEVQSFVGASARPHLDLAPDRFRVALDPAGGPSPRYWTARAGLCAPGVAAPLGLSASAPALWIRAADEEISPYRPQRRSASALVRADVRIESLSRRGDAAPEDAHRVVITGALTTESELALRREDVLAFSIPLPEGPLVVHATLDPARGASGWRFRSFPTEVAPAMLAGGRDLGGVVFRDTEIRLIPTFAAPFDLYALAVIAVRVLLVRSAGSVGAAIEAIVALGRKIGARREDEPLEAAIAAVCAADGDLRDALGAHRLIDADLAPGEADRAIPPAVWWSVLAAMLRMFPALGAFSVCSSLSDGPRDRPQRIFDRPVADLRRLAEQSRSLVVARQRENHEIRSVVESLLDPLPSPASRPASAGGALRS